MVLPDPRDWGSLERAGFRQACPSVGRRGESGVNKRGGLGTGNSAGIAT